MTEDMNRTEQNVYLAGAESRKEEAAKSIERAVSQKHEIRSMRADDVSPQEVNYLWKPYLLKGDVNILAAAGGTGKSFAVCGIVAELSNGRLPLNPFVKIDPVYTLYISTEDPAFIIRDRLEKAGANLSMVSIIDPSETAKSYWKLSDGRGNPDVSILEEAILTCMPNLVVIDPLHAIIGSDVKMTEQNVIRPFMQALANLAKTYQTAIIDIAHVSKRTAGNNANDAILGATDIVNASRSVLRVIFDETGTNPNRRVIVHTKSNYAPCGDSIAFELSEDGRLSWSGVSDVTKEDMEAAARKNQSISEYMANVEAGRRSSSFVAEQIEALAAKQTEKRKFYSYDTLREYGIKGKPTIVPCIGELNRQGVMVVFPDVPLREYKGAKSRRGIEIIRV